MKLLNMFNWVESLVKFFTLYGGGDGGGGGDGSGESGGSTGGCGGGGGGGGGAQREPQSAQSVPRTQ